MKKFCLIIIVTSTILWECQSQPKSSSVSRYFDTPILTDALSTLFFPIRYNESLLSTNKIALLGDYYANICVYDFKNDSYRKLFQSDTYIEAIRFGNYYYGGKFMNSNNDKMITSSWVFLLVKTNDYNKSGRIDGQDPSILFVTNPQGENLKSITRENENVVSFQLYAAQNFALIKIQRDLNKDQKFKSDDDDFYYQRINLTDLSMGKAIELK